MLAAGQARLGGEVMLASRMDQSAMLGAIVSCILVLASVIPVHGVATPVYLILRLDTSVSAPRCVMSTATLGCSLNPLFLLSEEAQPPLSTTARRLAWGAGQDYQCGLHTQKEQCTGDTGNRCQWLLGQCSSSDDYLWSCPGSQADIFYKCQNNNLDVQLLDFEEPTCPPSPDCVATSDSDLPCNARFLVNASAAQRDVFWAAKKSAESGRRFDSQLTGCCESSIVFRRLADARCSRKTTISSCRSYPGCRPRYLSKDKLSACVADGLPLPKEEVLSMLLSSSQGLGKVAAASNDFCRGLQDCGSAGTIRLHPDKIKMYQGPWNEPASFGCEENAAQRIQAFR